jgi:hypothetical protein
MYLLKYELLSVLEFEIFNRSIHLRIGQAHTGSDTEERANFILCAHFSGRPQEPNERPYEMVSWASEFITSGIHVIIVT